MIVIVSAKNLVKRYNGLTAVDQVSFEIERGECFCFLGPNGAGKTTTMRMIYGFSPVTEGELSVFGLSVDRDIRTIKQRIGVIPQENSLDPDLNVVQNLTIYARYFDIPRRDVENRITELLGFFQLSDKREEKIDRLSGGMKRRLILARALMNRPELLILDEPTTGLDPQARHLIWDRLKELKTQGMTMILTTHYMDEAMILSDRLVIMDHGRIVEAGIPAALVHKHGVNNLEEVFLKVVGRGLQE